MNPWNSQRNPHLLPHAITFFLFCYYITNLPWILAKKTLFCLGNTRSRFPKDSSETILYLFNENWTCRRASRVGVHNFPIIDIIWSELGQCRVENLVSSPSRASPATATPSLHRFTQRHIHVINNSVSPSCAPPWRFLIKQNTSVFSTQSH